MNRTHTLGELRLTDAGKQVTLIGWVSKRRNLGGMVFIDTLFPYTTLFRSPA